MARLLYISPGPTPPSSDPARTKFTHLGTDNHVDVLFPVWWRTQDEGEAAFFGAGFPTVNVGSATFHFFLLFGFPEVLRPWARLVFWIRKSLELKRSGAPFDAVVCYGTNLVGVAGVLISWLLGAKLIVEIPGTPSKAFIFDDARGSVSTKVRKWIADRLLKFVLKRADGLHTLFPTQMSDIPGLPAVTAEVFHDFVPVSQLPNEGEDHRYVIFLGFPWFLKGVDVLIRAFHEVAPEFPEVKLKVVGYFPNPASIVALANQNPQIEVIAAVAGTEAIRLINNSTVLVLPSRTESMGRVLLEAMACGKPVIGSRVDGIPHYIQDGENGLLFASEDISELAKQLRRVLRDPEEAARMGARGKALALHQYNEAAYRAGWDRLFVRVFSDLQSIKVPNNL